MGELAGNCHALISTLTFHVGGVEKFLTEGYASQMSLEYSLIQPLTALAELLDLMSRISLEPISTDYRRQCIAALMRATGVVHSLNYGGFTIIGAFLGTKSGQ